MATTNLLSRYRSIARPSLGSGGAFSSIAKKTTSAEDAVVDNQYSSGLISATSYLAKLQERSVRSYLTPLQRVTLTNKMSDVGQAVNDAEVTRKYQAGEYTTPQIVQYENDKLAQMTPGSETYIKQQQKVQTLTDKSEKEARNSYRIEQSKAISQLPDDNSQVLYQKAQMYETLAHQARLDGDNQQADVLETQMNNAQGAAKKAEINDVITNARFQISGNQSVGMGVPTADSGSALYAQLTGGRAPGYSSPAVKSALESLDRGKKTLDRLYQSKQEKENLLQAYQVAVGQASGDQKTTLTIAMNTLQDSLSQTDNSISITTQNINDTALKVNDLAGKAAFGGSKKEIQKQNIDLTNQEKRLEADLQRGYYTENGKKTPIDSTYYISKMANINTLRMEWATNAEAVYRANGDDGKADQLLTDIETKYNTQMAAQIRDTILGIVSKTSDPKEQEKLYGEALGSIAKDYALMRTEPGGTLDDITSSARKPGDVSLKNVKVLRDQGILQNNYINDNGVLTKIYPENMDSLTGKTLSSSDIRSLFSKGAGSLYYYDVNGDKKKVVQVNIKDANGNISPILRPEDSLRVVNADGSLGDIKPIFKSQNQSIYNIDPGKTPGQGIGIGPWSTANIPGNISKVVDVASKALNYVNPYGNLAKAPNPVEGLANLQKGIEQVPGFKQLAQLRDNPGYLQKPVGDFLSKARDVATNAMNAIPLKPGFLPKMFEGAVNDAGQIISKTGQAIANAPQQLLNKVISFLPKAQPKPAPTPVAQAISNSGFIGPQLPGVSAPTPTPPPAPFRPAPAPAPAPFRLPQIQLPKINIPQIQLPKIQLPNFQPAVNSAISNIQKFTAPVVNPIVNTVRNVASGIGNFFGGLFGRRR